MKTDNGFPAKAGVKWTREKVKRHLVQRFYTRFHMSLILASSALAAMLANWLLLHGGVYAMWLRYPVAVSVAYLAFLAGVRLWLQYMGLVRSSDTKSSLVENLDVPDIPLGNSAGKLELPDGLPRGGGQFGGGGAHTSWTEANPARVFAATSRTGDSPSAGMGAKLGDFADLDGEGLVLLLLALLLIASVFLLSGYVIWFAPDILGEAAIGALLAGGLAKPAKRQDNSDWVAGVVKKTWWPFALVLVLSLAFAIYAATHYPEAKTFRQAVGMATGK
ncbi:MAG: hypothetical protein Q8O38_10765 [Sulfurimicrobium sp.]|nr:hypothetical protein [Sulfurimicrobium sp.]